MEKEYSIVKFHINNKILYVRVYWEPNQSELFHIIVYDGEAAWAGRFSYEFAKKYQDRCDETKEQYVTNVKRALVKDSNFSYNFKVQPDDSTCAAFSWKKIIKGYEAVLHGCVPLHRQGAKESKDFLLDFLLAENQELRNTIEFVNVRNIELTADLDKCKSDLDKFVEIKTSLEMSLYSKFAQLLNAKKRRMELLEINGKYSSKSNVNKIEEGIDSPYELTNHSNNKL